MLTANSSGHDEKEWKRAIGWVEQPDKSILPTTIYMLYIYTVYTAKQQSSLLADVGLMARCCRTMYQEETPEDRAKELQAEREQRRQEQFLVRIAGSNAHRMIPALARTVSTRPWDKPALKHCNGFTQIKRQSRGLLGGTCSCFYGGTNGVVELDLASANLRTTPIQAVCKVITASDWGCCR